MLFSRLIYYLSSIPTLLLGVKNWPAMLSAFVRRPTVPFMIELRNGARFQVRTPMDIWVLKEAYLDRQYEKASVEIRDGWTIMDIGAGIGDFAIAAAREHPHCRVYAYEPFPDSYVLLQENLRLNRIENVVAFPLAVSGQTGSSELRAITTEPVQYSTATSKPVAHADTTVVRTTTLDRAFGELGLDHCDYLKVDCEGAEYEIFMQASPATLASIKHICMEYHDGVVQYSHGDLAAFLTNNGFQVTSIRNPVHAQLGLLYAHSTL